MGKKSILFQDLLCIDLNTLNLIVNLKKLKQFNLGANRGSDAFLQERKQWDSETSENLND